MNASKSLSENPPIAFVTECEIAVSDIASLKYGVENRHDWHYLKLRESISRIGLEEPLVVAKQPGDSKYTLIAGGNSRLQIVQELYDATGDTRFKSVKCVEKEWSSEFHACVGHLISNDIRGRDSFIDRAKSILYVLNIRAEELGVDSLSQRKSVKELNDGGYTISQPILGYMKYAAERLYSVLPTALDAGLGKPHVQKIRELETKALKFWERCGLSQDSFDEMFLEVCKRSDSKELHFDEFCSDFEMRLSKECGKDLWSVREVLHSSFPSSNSSADAKAPKEHLEIEDGSSCTEQRQEESENTNGDESLNNSSVQSVGQPKAATIDGFPPPTPEKKTRKSTTTNRELRQHAWTLATRLASRQGLSKCIMQVKNMNCGFLVIDLPNEKVSWASKRTWEYLAIFCGVAETTVESLLHYVPDSSLWKASLKNQNPNEIPSAPDLDLLMFSAALWSVLDDEDWALLLGLWDTVRTIRNRLTNLGRSVWNEQETELIQEEVA